MAVTDARAREMVPVGSALLYLARKLLLGNKGWGRRGEKWRRARGQVTSTSGGERERERVR